MPIDGRQLFLAILTWLLLWEGDCSAVIDKDSVDKLVTEFSQLAERYHQVTATAQAQGVPADPEPELNDPEELLAQIFGTGNEICLKLWHLFLFDHTKHDECANTAHAALKRFLSGTTFALTFADFVNNPKGAMNRHYYAFLFNQLLGKLKDYRSAKAPKAIPPELAELVYTMIKNSTNLYHDAVWTGIMSGKFWPPRYKQQALDRGIHLFQRCPQYQELDQAMEEAYDQFLSALITITLSDDLQYPGAGVYLLLLRTIMEACNFLPFLIHQPQQPPQDTMDWDAQPRHHALAQRATADFMIGAVRNAVASLLNLIPKETSRFDAPVLGFFNLFCNNGFVRPFCMPSVDWATDSPSGYHHFVALIQTDLRELGHQMPLGKCLSAKKFLETVLVVAREVHFHPNWFTMDMDTIVFRVEFKLLSTLKKLKQSDTIDDTSKARFRANLAVTYFPTLVAYDLFAPYLHKAYPECCTLLGLPLIACLATCFGLCCPPSENIDATLNGIFGEDRTRMQVSKSSRRRAGYLPVPNFPGADSEGSLA